MIFLGPLYDWVKTAFADNINHFPLIRLVVLSLDKTLLYLLVLLALRVTWLAARRRKPTFKREALLGMFSAYILLVLFLTVFRGSYYFPWQLQFHVNRPLTAINMMPLVETWKLTRGATMFDFYYQSLGNIAWFVPFGLFLPIIIRGRAQYLRTILFGSGFSLAIEAMQFVLITGVTDIDDWIFNTIGVLIGCIMICVIRIAIHIFRK